MLIAHSPKLILPILTCISFLVVMCCFILHLKNHFGLKDSVCNNLILLRTKSNCESSRDINTYKPKGKRRHSVIVNNGNSMCCCNSSTGRIEFYPVSTLLYFAFLLCSILYITIFHFDYYLYPPAIIEYCPIKNNILSFINNPYPFNSLPVYTNVNIELYIGLYIGLLLLLWETLFNFYRFYDATYMSTYLRNASRIRIFSLFSIYMFPFSALFSIQIHFYYGLLPLIIFIHFIFNTYCAIGFVNILKNQYIHLWEGEAEQIKNHRIIQELVNIINRVQRCSIITTFTSSLILFILNGCYTNYTIILLPLLWMISAIVWMLNFTKNKSWINKKYKSFKRKVSITNKHNTNTNTNTDSNKQKTLKLKSETNNNNKILIKVQNNNRKLNQNRTNHINIMSSTNDMNDSNDISIDIKVNNTIETQTQIDKQLNTNTNKPIEKSLPIPMFALDSIDDENENENEKSMENINQLQHHDENSYVYPKDFNSNIHLENIDGTPEPLSKTKSVSKTNSKHRKVLEILGVIGKSNSIENNPMEIPENASKITHGLSSTIDFDLYKYNNSKVNLHNIINELNSPVSPGSCDENTVFDVRRMSINSKSMKNDKSKNSISQTPGPMKKDFNFGADNLTHNRSLSTMSGLIIKQKNLENNVIAAENILHMMVTQGFYSKRNLNSVNQIRNLAM